MKNIKIIDLTQFIENNMPIFPGDKNTVLSQRNTVEKNGSSNYYLRIGLHTGTHIDAPAHMLAAGKTLDKYPLERFIGRGVLLNAANEKIIKYKEEYESLVKEDDIALIYTGHSKCYYTSKYFTDYPTISNELIEFLIMKKIKILGIDFHYQKLN